MARRQKSEDPQHEALEAIEQVAALLASDTPLTPLERVRASATLEFARRKVGDIPVLTRVRKPRAEGPSAATTPA